VRIVAQLDDYFNYDYDQREFISIRCTHLSGGWIHGYVHLANSLANQLVELLFDGRPRRMTIGILAAKNPSHALITHLVSSSWVIPDETAKQ
jgi:hypothetical protein